ncbi:hypothetical protein [Bdellovibrio sp.]|uniref:hypothetical protein n=1 Tax=Bdellovibrio sp. TaxID=28201 RepID=UPI003221D13F
MKKKMSVEDALIQSLKDAHEFEVGKKKLTARTRELPHLPLSSPAKRLKSYARYSGQLRTSSQP